MQPRLFSNVKDVFLLSCFHNRLNQYLFMYHWSRNELIIARKYAFRALTQTSSDLIKASIHINLGLTYTFDTYQQGMYHLNAALSLAEGIGAKKVIDTIKIHNIPFLSAHFGETEGIETVDQSEQAHLEIARGNISKAIAILENSPLSNPFDLYYMGLAKRDKDLLTASYNHFIEKQGDLFFARLPLNAMKKLFGETIN
ncbi:AimR family lysis-lysogeny pheromone receptor [Virgibacillus halophilus]|uniref:AimR family lysis-lysogeny pheromone receptor n=2 Tax=Tigheibacillus halophilus TaxID=361280 RepID=A0ABU5C5R8_9BACI|nr:AimR family lysis-lysogeny pheromone receptor [Virgibacillus halophilus]